MSNYPTNLTEKQWQVIKNIVEPQERRRKTPIREIINAVFYLCKSGCQWRMLPRDFAPWQTVYYYFRKWRLDGVWESLVNALRTLARKSAGRDASPSLCIIDSRSVKTSHHVDAERGRDGHKRIKGRKEHIVVDSLGLLMAVKVHRANIHDSKGAAPTIGRLRRRFPRLAKILADGGYRGKLGKWVKDTFGWELEVATMSGETSKKGGKAPMRWIVERTFAWLENYRRLTIDHEFLAATAEAMVQVVFTQIILKRFF